MASRILVVTPDVLAERMAGPAIRAWHIAAALAADSVDATPLGHTVALVSTSRCSLTGDGFTCTHVSWDELPAFAADYDVLIVQGFVTYFVPALLRGDQVIIVDLYDPLHLEQLEQLRDVDPLMRRTTIDLTTRVLNAQAARGDFFLCANDEQRHLWLGLLGAMGRLNPLNYDADPSLQSLLTVCPFGMAAEGPRRKQPALRGVVDGIGTDDKVLLWAGGIYNWFDPLTLLRAIAELAPRHPDVRLFFMGMTHPSADAEVMSMATRARQLADELQLAGKHVFFNDGWVRYHERADYLLEADAGVSTHVQHAETEFAFRTRILDYLWAGLPIVSTAGDSFGRLVATEELGRTVPEGDVARLAEALEAVLYDEQVAHRCRANVTRVRSSFTWEVTLAPLLAFCREPRRAPDAAIDQGRMARRPVPPMGRAATVSARAADLWHEGGPGLLAARLARKAGRALTRSRRQQ